MSLMFLLLSVNVRSDSNSNCITGDTPVLVVLELTLLEAIFHRPTCFVDLCMSDPDLGTITSLQPKGSGSALWLGR